MLAAVLFYGCATSGPPTRYQYYVTMTSGKETFEKVEVIDINPNNPSEYMVIFLDRQAQDPLNKTWQKPLNVPKNKVRPKSVGMSGREAQYGGDFQSPVRKNGY